MDKCDEDGGNQCGGRYRACAGEGTEDLWKRDRLELEG